MWTHLEGFDRLTSAELDALLEAPVLIAALVGAADGEFDREERSWTDRLMFSRTYNKPKHLNEFYSVVSNDFLPKVDAALERFPQEADDRNRVISDRLTLINPILAKLGEPLGADLYESFVGLAKETAKASGGFLRFGAINAKEAPWVKLPMLTPVVGPGTPGDPWDEEPETEE
jgi:hypothetical protein